MREPPQRWVAFLRAINIAQRRVRMETLRAAFAELGYEDVATHVATGNVVFRSAEPREDIQRRVEERLRTDLGFDVPAFVRTDREVRQAAAKEPFRDVEDIAGLVQIAFLRAPLTAAGKRALRELETPRDRLAASGSHVYWLTAGGMRESLLSWRKVEAVIAQPTTLRSVQSVRKLVEAHLAR